MDNNQQIEIDNTFAKYAKYLNPNSAAFCKRIYSGGLDKYIRRLQAIGYQDLNMVLDAGCGFGQWTLALAKLNKHVSAVDSSSDRLFYLEALIQALKLPSIDIQWADISALPFSNNSFDGIICYGVIFCSDWQKSLAEFHRILKPKGRLYVTANGLGYQLLLWKESPNKVKGYDPRFNVTRNLQNTLNYSAYKIVPEDGQIVIEPEEFSQVVVDLGFKIVGQGDEGSICVDPSLSQPEKFFLGKYYGEIGVYEFLIEKI